MLRGLALALLGLSLLAGPASARGDGPAGRARAEARNAGAKSPERVPLLRRVSFARPAASAGPAACANRAAARGSKPRCRAASRGAGWSWAQGLPPALNVQTQGCPAGTMATLAEGHDDIVRCLPF